MVLEKGFLLKHLMAISDGPFSGTGFGEELRHVLFGLAQTKKFDITWQSLQHFGYPTAIPDTMFADMEHVGSAVKLYSGTQGDVQNFGADCFLKNYREINPEMVLFMGDPRNIAGYRNLKTQLGFPLIFYTTLDGLPIHPAMTEHLNFSNVIVTMTEWAQKEYQKVGFYPAMIHHGINSKWWNVSKEEKYETRRAHGIPDDVTVYINWDVPQHRKRPDALARCWRDFIGANKDKKAILIWYSDWNMGRSLGYNIEALLKQYEVPRENIIDPITVQGSPKYWDRAETPEQLRKIASMADVYLSTTSGEGFGKCGLEAMAMGIPVVITDYSACSEVHQKGSILVPCYEGRAGRYRMDDKRRCVEAGIVNEEKFVEAMNYLYEDENRRRKLGVEAKVWASTFDYEKCIIPEWQRLLGGLDTSLIAAKELLNL